MNPNAKAGAVSMEDISESWLITRHVRLFHVEGTNFVAGIPCLDWRHT